MLVHANHVSQFYRNMALNASLEINANMFFETGVGTVR